MSIRQSIAGRYVSAGSADSASFPGATLAGSAIVVRIVTYDGGGAPDWTVADDDLNTYTSYKSPSTVDGNPALARAMFFVAENIAGDPSQQITVTPDSTGSSFWDAVEIDEVPASGILAAAEAFWADSDSDPTATVTSPTPSQSGNVVLVAFGSRENFGTFSLTNATSGYTEDFLDTTQSGSAISANMAHKVGSASAQTAAWSHGLGSPGAAGMLVIKQNVGGGTVNSRVVSETVRMGN